MSYPNLKYQVRDYICSEEHPDLAAKIEPTEIQELKLYYVHTILVQTIHRETGFIVPYVESGLRSPELNAAVGSKSTQHMAGEAVDITFPQNRSETINIFNFIKEELKHPTGYCILYLDLKKKRFKQIHWALPLGPDRPPRKNPRKFWYYDGKRFYHILPPGVSDWE